LNMVVEERGKSVPQFGSHPVEQKIAQQITTEMKTTEMKLCPRHYLKNTFVHDGEPIKFSIMSSWDIGRNIQAVFCMIPVRKQKVAK
jgi:hypothetical protein